MDHRFVASLFTGSIVPYTYLLQAALVFTISVAGILLFIAFFLYRHGRQEKNKARLRLLFSDLVAGIALCEGEGECSETLQTFLDANKDAFTKAGPRRTLAKEIVKTMDSISGQAAGNLRWLYETLGLDRDTLQRFASGEWYKKAGAIQHLAEMQQSQYLVKIYRETNNRNPYIRTEAQVAVVKLTGFKGLRFLTIVSHPVSQWQQLSLISHLQEGEIEGDMIKKWLLSKNDSVVEFALRLICIYKCHSLHNEVMESLRHPSATVRLQALHTAKEISTATTTRVLLQHFSTASKEEQPVILDLLLTMEADNNCVQFLTSLLHHEDEAIRFRAMKAIQHFSPAWSSVVRRKVRHHSSFTYILSTLEKKAV